ncbi:MAG: hypothetical protein ACK5NT_07865 [Pyrinomonadaceae bacterium]
MYSCVQFAVTPPIPGAAAYKEGHLNLEDIPIMKVHPKFGKSVARKPLGQILAQQGFPKGARGNFSDRTFNIEDIGIPIRKLNASNIKFTKRGVDVVEKHLTGFVDGKLDEPERIMLDRLRKIADGELKASPQDRNFYAHELREFMRYKYLGQNSTNRDRNFWNDLHTATLEDYGIKEYDDKGASTLYTRYAARFF